jgi:hypothetical protein
MDVRDETGADRIVIGRAHTLEVTRGKLYLHPRSRPRIVRPTSKQETAPDGTREYVDPFDVSADWEERA